MSDVLMRINDLHIHYVTSEAHVYAVNGVSFELKRGETLGLIGETGAGKTTIAKAILGILPKLVTRVQGGEILFDGQNIFSLDEEDLRDVRGNRITIIFQDPMTALNPVMTVGSQIAEVVMLHSGGSAAEARKRAIEMLEIVGIPAERYVEYPHQFSGGMRQRVVIAIALACNPELLLADEPTTALDVTIQAQVLELMRELNKKNRTSMIMITHDLGVVAEMCDNVAIVYAGQIVEIGTLEDIFDNPSHPYTVGLFNAMPAMIHQENARLKPIDGMPPDPTDLPLGCYFHPRCPHVMDECKNSDVPMLEISPGHFSKCLRSKALTAGRDE